MRWKILLLMFLSSFYVNSQRGTISVKKKKPILYDHPRFLMPCKFMGRHESNFSIYLEGGISNELKNLNFIGGLGLEYKIDRFKIRFGGQYLEIENEEYKNRLIGYNLGFSSLNKIHPIAEIGHHFDLDQHSQNINLLGGIGYYMFDNFRAELYGGVNYDVEKNLAPRFDLRIRYTFVKFRD